MEEKMNKNRIKAIVVGILILVAYAVLAGEVLESRGLVMLFEIIAGVAVIGIAVIMFPLFKTQNKGLTLGYLAGKIIEGGIMIVAGIMFLSLSASIAEARDFIYVIHTYIFILSGFIFYYLLYKSKLIPRFISIWGIIASISLLIGNFLEMNYDHPLLKLLYVLIVLNEVFLAIWLMAKGFNLREKEK